MQHDEYTTLGGDWPKERPEASVKREIAKGSRYLAWLVRGVIAAWGIVMFLLVYWKL